MSDRVRNSSHQERPMHFKSPLSAIPWCATTLSLERARKRLRPQRPQRPGNCARLPFVCHQCACSSMRFRTFLLPQFQRHQHKMSSFKPENAHDLLWFYIFIQVFVDVSETVSSDNANSRPIAAKSACMDRLFLLCRWSLRPI